MSVLFKASELRMQRCACPQGVPAQGRIPQVILAVILRTVSMFPTWQMRTLDSKRLNDTQGHLDASFWTYCTPVG